MNPTAAIDRFNEDDLARAPALLDGVITTLIGALTRPVGELPPAWREQAPRLASALALRRQRMLADYHAALRQGGRPQASASPRPPRAQGPRPLELSLVDEGTVAADVETARVADAIRAAADHELRELGGFLAALAGQSHVTHNHLALHPEVHARALWAASRQLDTPEDRLGIPFMHRVAAPFTQALRRHWAAACGWLEDAGIEPAAYRTVVLHAGVRTDTEAPPEVPRHGLRAIAQAMAVIEQRLVEAQRLLGQAVPSAGPMTITPGLSTPGASGHTNAAPMGRPRPEPDLPAPRVSAVAQLVDALQGDARVPADLRPAVGKLRALALSLAAIDPMLGVDEDHPLWVFIDRIAWQARCLPAPPQRERVRAMMVVNGLVDELLRDAVPSAARLAWANQRLLALELNRLERRVRQQAAPIAALRALDARLAATGSSPRAAAAEPDLDELPTVPATLFDPIDGPPGRGSAAEAWLNTLQPGATARLQIDGRWILAVLLWRSDTGGIWLWGECTSDATWPVRRDALAQLFEQRLAVPAAPDALVRTLAHELSRRDSRLQAA